MFSLTCFDRDIKSLCIQDIKTAAKMSRGTKRTTVGVEGEEGKAGSMENVHNERCMHV